MRIGFDARLISALGIGRYISGLLPELARILGDRLVVVARPAEVALVRALTEGGGTILICDAGPYRLAEQSLLLVKLNRARLSLVHFPHYSLPIAYRGRFVTTIHDLFSFHFPEIHSNPLPRLANRVLIGNAIRHARAIITPSNATASDVAARFPECRSRLRPIAEAANDRFSPSRNQAAESSWHRYFRIQPPYFLYLGQWKAYKNVPLLIEAFARLRAGAPVAQLVIAGEDERHPEVREAAARLKPGSVLLPGRLPEDAIPDLYRSATALMLPSRAEGFGLPVLEAMACGVPVICSDIPVLREVAGDAATFCNPNDPGAFAAAMRAALDGQLDPFRVRQGLERARMFSWRKAATETVEVYERALT